MIFRTTLLPTGKTAAGIVVPPEIVDALAAGRRPPVRVTINNHTYRSTIAVRGGQYLLGVSAENRRAARIQPGDEIASSLPSTPNRGTSRCRPSLPTHSTTNPRRVRDLTLCPTAPSNASRCQSRTLGHPRPGNAASKQHCTPCAIRPTDRDRAYQPDTHMSFLRIARAE